MSVSIIAPGKYIQGKGELKKIKNSIEKLGKKFLFLASPSGLKRIEGTITESFKEDKDKILFDKFNGECCKSEINRIIKVMNENSCDVIVGVGGGKILDTAKAVAYYAHTPVVIVPTIASTDAPCSALSVIYTEEGVFSEYLVLPKNPDIVLMDTEVVASAPSRLLVSGMGDALATYFEARACVNSNAKNMSGDQSTKAAYALAKLCYDTLLEDGLKAKISAENNVATKALENIVEANTYLSGIGFESSGLAAAHAIHNGFTVLKECHHLYHGEKVAFGTIVQLVLENSSLDELEEVIGFCIEIGLPVTLREMGLQNVTEEQIMEVSKASCAEGETIHNMPFKVTPEDVFAAIKAADSLGKMYL